MGFFDQRPEPAPVREADPVPWARPETVLPGIAADTVILARTDDAVLALSELRAYPNGFQLVFTAVVRQPPGRPGFGSNGFLRRYEPGPVPDTFLRFGMRFADGTVLTNLDADPGNPGEVRPRLMPEGGHGGRRRYEQSYWVSPLPPPGRLDVVVEWPAQGIPETTVELGAAVVLDAARRAQTLFGP
ncbi:hypothetical protein ACQP1P_27495 [Dactylosporangium sp. CA-052675]|uniref:hypothetical protein n=1 Tax=Dactylosporangium sp. CA-052675 TaxID=3239927 RepID=UPI003D9304C7